MNNTENTTNEAMVNNQAQDQTAVATQQPAPAADDQKKGFFTKAKETAKKVWNSKPAKVVKTVALVGGGFAAGMLVAGAGKAKDDDSDQAVAEADYSESPVDDAEA